MWREQNERIFKMEQQDVPALLQGILGFVRAEPLVWPKLAPEDCLLVRLQTRYTGYKKVQE